MAKEKPLLETIDNWVMKGKKKPKKESKKPITSEQIEDVQGEICYLADEIAFLQEIFRDTHADLEPHHQTGLSKILEHIHADSYKALSLLDELELQVRD